MKKTVLLLVGLASLNSFAGNLAVEKAAAKMKSSDTRTIIKTVENTDGNPCMPEGKSFQVELQVKQASFDREKMKVVYTWETAKTIGVDKAGQIMEVCAE